VTVCCFRGADGAKKDKAMSEVTEKLNATWCDLQKASKVGHVLLGRAEAVKSKTPTMQKAITAELTALESVEKCKDDLGFMLKFKKSKDTSSMYGSACMSVYISYCGLHIDVCMVMHTKCNGIVCFMMYTFGCMQV